MIGTDTVAISAAALDAMVAHARQDAPDECCGLLVGTTNRIDEAVATPSVERSPNRYQVDPAAHFTLIRQLRGTDRAIVGAYHSHPRSAPEPSPTDREQAFEDFLYVIAGPIQGALPLDVRAYRLRNGHFEAVELIVDERPEAVSPPATRQ